MCTPHAAYTVTYMSRCFVAFRVLAWGADAVVTICKGVCRQTTAKAIVAVESKPLLIDL